MSDYFSVTAVTAASTLSNCSVNLYLDKGRDVGGRWQESLELINESISATIQRAKASEIKRFERGGERLEGGSRLYLASEPAQKPDIVAVGGDLYKVHDVDFRPSRQYWRLLIARQLP